jgi:hypothetical protein
MEKHLFKHPGTQSNKASTISSVPSDKLKFLEQVFLLPTGPQSSNSLPKLENISDLSSHVSTTSASKNQFERMSLISGETLSLLSGLSGLEEPSPSEIEAIFNSSVSTTSASKSQVGRMSVTSLKTSPILSGALDFIEEKKEKGEILDSSVSVISSSSSQTERSFIRKIYYYYCLT